MKHGSFVLSTQRIRIPSGAGTDAQAKCSRRMKGIQGIKGMRVGWIRQPNGSPDSFSPLINSPGPSGKARRIQPKPDATNHRLHPA
jgi:hypothetical protein